MNSQSISYLLGKYALCNELLDNIRSNLVSDAHEFTHHLYDAAGVICPVYPLCELPFYDVEDPRMMCLQSPAEDYESPPLNMSLFQSMDDFSLCSWKSTAEPHRRWSTMYRADNTVVLTRKERIKRGHKFDYMTMVVRLDDSLRIAGICSDDQSPVLQGNNFLKWDRRIRSGIINYVSGYFARSAENLFSDALEFIGRSTIDPPHLSFSANIISFYATVEEMEFDNIDDDSDIEVDDIVLHHVMVQRSLRLWDDLLDAGCEFPFIECPQNNRSLKEASVASQSGLIYPTLSVGKYSSRDPTDPIWDIRAVDPVAYRWVYDSAESETLQESFPESDNQDEYPDSMWHAHAGGFADSTVMSSSAVPEHWITHYDEMAPELQAFVDRIAGFQLPVV